MRKTALCGFVTMNLLLSAQAAGAALQEPVTVSPGCVGKVAQIESRCPTFSWGAAERAKSYELVVYRVTADGKEAERVLHHKLPGAALSWTPSLSRCLDTESRYGWAVRGVGEGFETGWSEERLFRVDNGPAEADAAAALAVLRRFLDEGGSLEELAATEPIAEEPSSPNQASDRLSRADSSGAASATATQIDVFALPLRGLSSFVELPGGSERTAFAVGGEWARSDSSPGRAGGYLGVRKYGAQFEGFPHLSYLDESEIGVLGIAGLGSDYAVVGASDLSGTAGFFFNADDGGQVSTGVVLSSGLFALLVAGPSKFFSPLELPYEGELASSGDFGPEVYKIIDGDAPRCSVLERGSITVMRPSAAGQDALCFCGAVGGGYDWWCFNP